MTPTTSNAPYADASALVKLLLTEPASAELRAFLGPQPDLVTSQLSVVEVHRATRLANPSSAMTRSTRALLSECGLTRASDEVIERAREIASRRLRGLDAIHLASALRLGVRHFITYDRRLLEAASDAGLQVLHPGLDL